MPLLRLAQAVLYRELSLSLRDRVDEKQREVVRLSWVGEVCCFVGLLDVTVPVSCPPEKTPQFQTCLIQVPSNSIDDLWVLSLLFT